MKRFRLLLVAVLLFGYVSPAHSQGWNLGVEREYTPGRYAKLLSVFEGWRLWRFESVSGVDCRAVKPAIGKPHPVPGGNTTMMEGAPPFVVMNYDHEGKLVWEFEGEFGDTGSIDWRRENERFYTRYLPFQISDMERRILDGQFVDTLAHLDGETISVLIITWEYPSPLYINESKLTAKFNFLGLSEMIKALKECEIRD